MDFDCDGEDAVIFCVVEDGGVECDVEVLLVLGEVELSKFLKILPFSPLYVVCQVSMLLKEDISQYSAYTPTSEK